MNKSILWYQHQNPKEDDVVFLNGEKLVNRHEIQENFEIISIAANKAIGKPTPWCGMLNGCFFLKGFLNSKDNIGRTMSFLYLTNNKDYKSACVAEISTAGLIMSEETKKCLYNQKRNRLTIICIIIIFVILLFSIVHLVNI